MQRFWRITKKIMTMAAVLFSAVLFVGVLTSAMKQKQSLVCKSVQVKIDYESGLAFLSKQEIKARIDYLCGGQAIGKTLSELDWHTIEKEIEKNPYIKNAEVFTDQAQNVIVEVIQKRPVLRVINNDGVSYYIGEDNERIPLCNTFTVHVAVALGNVLTHADTKRDSMVQSALYNLIQLVRKDDFFDAMIDQIYVNAPDNFDLLPRTGGHVIHLGDPTENVEEKLARLKIFYKEGLSKVGWDKYKAIDLQYDGQVVGERKDTTNTI